MFVPGYLQRIKIIYWNAGTEAIVTVSPMLLVGHAVKIMVADKNVQRIIHSCVPIQIVLMMAQTTAVNQNQTVKVFTEEFVRATESVSLYASSPGF